eukprot:2359112-Rhodomonas_salina.3
MNVELTIRTDETCDHTAPPRTEAQSSTSSLSSSANPAALEIEIAPPCSLAWLALILQSDITTSGLFTSSDPPSPAPGQLASPKHVPLLK